MKMREIVFDFSGNCLCLNFANTLEDRASDVPRELLTTYNDLIEWAEQAQIVTGEQARALLAEAESHKGKAEKVLQRARDWREALYRIFFTLANGEGPQGADLRLLNAALAEAMVHACIMPAGDGFAWRWDMEPSV